jgi:probable rRNA maturation factor
VARAAEAAGAPQPASVGLVLSDDAELAELNERHLNAEGSTDVLSFPLLAPEAYPPHPGKAERMASPVASLGGTPAMGDEGPGRPRPAFALPAGVRTHLGDIIVSVERAITQSAEGRGGQTGDVRWSPADELLLLVTHGALHLCGWDHADPVERDAMRALERELLAGK